MSNQDFPFGYNHLGVGNPFDFPLDNEFSNDTPNFEPTNSLLFNGFGLTGRSIVSHSAMSHPGLGRGRMPVLGPFFRPLVNMHEGLQMNPPFPDSQSQLPFAPRLSNPALVVRTDPPASLVRAALPQPPPQPAMSGRNRKRRASEKAISELKHMRLIDLKEDDDCCIICMEAFVDIKSSTDEPKSENALQMPCGHVFGSHCLKLWLKDHSTCPTCRKEVDFVEEDERSERAVGEMNRRRNAIDRDMAHLRRAAERIARRQVHHGQHARDDISGAVRHQVLEVELIVQQRQRITAPRLDPAAREHGAEDVSWTHALLQPNSHYSPYLDMFPQGRDSIHEVEGPMNPRHSHPTLSHPRVPHLPQALPRPLQAYNNHPGVIHRAGPPQGIFSPDHSFTHRQQPQPQLQQPSTMPQRSQSRGQSQRQSPYFDSYPGVNLVGRVPVLPNSGPIDEASDLVDALNDSPRVLRGPVSGCTRHLSGAQHNPHGIPRQDHQQSLQSHYQGLGGDMSYLWEPNGQLHHQQQQYQHQQQLLQQQQQQRLRRQTYTDSSHEVSMNHLPGPACVAGPQLAAHAPHQQRQQQCAYTEMGMCQHQFSFANSSGFAAGGIAVVAPEMAQIVNLNCGHGFHRACLLSTKNRAPRVVGSAVWLCGRCGKYEPERGSIEGRQQALEQAQQTVG